MSDYEEQVSRLRAGLEAARAALHRERESAAAVKRGLVTERDEALREAELLRTKASDDWDAAYRVRDEAIAERDEARAEVAAARERVCLTAIGCGECDCCRATRQIERLEAEAAHRADCAASDPRPTPPVGKTTYRVAGVECTRKEFEAAQAEVFAKPTPPVDVPSIGPRSPADLTGRPTPPERPRAKHMALSVPTALRELERPHEAHKADNGKPRWDLLPFDSLEDVAAVMSFGGRKYAPHNWSKGMAWGRLLAACLRHLSAWALGRDTDDESGLPHLAHAGACVLMLGGLVRRGKGTDDRCPPGGVA